MAETWTPDCDARLRALWAEGLATEAIGRRMKRSKGSIVGRAHRLALPRRPSPIVAGARRPARPAAAARIPRRVMQAVGLCAEAARAGRAAPSNTDIAEMLGLETSGSGSALMMAAVRLGLLRVEGRACRRIVSAPDGSWATAHPDEVGPAAAPDRQIPAPAGDAAPAATAGLDVSSLTAPPGPVRPPAGVFSGGSASVLPRDARGCRWPLWAHEARPDGRYCGAAQASRRDGTHSPYCAAHHAQAYTRDPPREDGHRITRSTFAWGGVAA